MEFKTGFASKYTRICCSYKLNYLSSYYKQDKPTGSIEICSY